MKLCNTEQYITAMAQAALNDGKDPVAYAQNYGIDLNAASGTPIKVWNPATNDYVTYTANGLYNGFINQKQTMPLLRYRLGGCHLAHRILTGLRPLAVACQRQAQRNVLRGIQGQQRYP